MWRGFGRKIEEKTHFGPEIESGRLPGLSAATGDGKDLTPPDLPELPVTNRFR